jgi:hypothetical protein
MRYAVSFGFILAFSFSAFAQRHEGGNTPPQQNFVRPSSSFGYGFGRVVYPGTGVPSGRNTVTFPFSVPTPTLVQRVGDSGRGQRGHRQGPGLVPIIYPVPVYVGADYYSEPSYSQEPQQTQVPNITIVMPPQQAAPAVQAPAASEVHSYTAPAAQPQDTSEEQVMFFVALKDSSVYTALAYWVEDSTLHYITSQGKHNQVSLDLVDRQTSARLNEGRKVEFRLPAPR